MRNLLRSETRRLLVLLVAAAAPLQLAIAQPTGAAPAAPPAAKGAEAQAKPPATKGAEAQAKPPAAKGAEAEAKPPADAGPKAQLKVPLFSELFTEVPVAQVGDGVITVAELADGLALMHQDRAPGPQGGKMDLGPALDRLINAKLIVLEARAMGLDELDEITKAVAQFKATTLRETIKQEVTKDVGPDPLEVEKAYGEAAREWKLASVLFAKEEDASAMREALQAGKSFDELSAKAIAEKKAKGAQEAGYILGSKMHPLVQAAVQKLERGATSAPIKLPDGFAIVRVEDFRVGNDPQARAMLEKASRDRLTAVALVANYRALTKEYAKVDTALLKRLDYHAKRPGLAALFKDKRVLARIQGGKPVTVEDLTVELSRKFYHGAERAVEEKKINKEKQDVFDSLLYRRLLEREAEQRRIAESDGFRRKITRFEDSLLFSRFIEQVIAPTVSVTEGEGKKRYEEKKASYLYPHFYKLESLAFTTTKDAEKAIAKLKAGTDVKWLRANAENQVQEPKLQFDGATYAATMLDGALQKVLAGAKAGDFRLYAAEDGTAYALRVVDETPAAPQPYTEVREVIVRGVFAEKLGKAIEEWSKKLRAAHEVNVFVTRIGE
jgi:hypothetical protein